MPLNGRIDLRSDTVTQPCEGMKQAMINAPLGDDVLGDDPTVHKLEAKIAEMLGKEDALFVPSGTMSNQIALWIQSKRADAVALHHTAHIYQYEAAGPAVLSGLLLKTVGGDNGIIDVDELKSVFPPDDPHFAPVTLVCAEDTANKGGGTVYPLETLDMVAQIAHQQGAKAHLDGARLFNAVAASGVSAARRAQNYDTVSICFSKGLGAPVGSALCLPASLKKAAIRARKILGGGMRQSGMLAAAALYALENNVERLIEDHARVQRLAQALQEHGYTVRWPDSNMVYFEVEDPTTVIAKAKETGIDVLSTGPTTIRAVVHKHIDDTDIERCIAFFGSL
jgi:threonine aldolase